MKNLFKKLKFSTINYITNGLCGACYAWLIDIVDFFVEHEADINEKNDDGITPLFVACHKVHLDVVEYLVEHGADINKENNGGFIPLYAACYEVHLKYFVEHGADINKRDNNSYTPLQIACQEGHIDDIRHFTLKNKGTENDLSKNHAWYKYIYIYI